MSKEKIFRFLFICFIMFFLVILFSSENKFNSETTKAKVLTEEQIKIFEQDIKEGKNIDISSYINKQEKEYTNTLSNSIYKVSLELEKVIDKSIKYLFREISTAISE